MGCNIPVFGNPIQNTQQNNISGSNAQCHFGVDPCTNGLQATYMIVFLPGAWPLSVCFAHASASTVGYCIAKEYQINYWFQYHFPFSIFTRLSVASPKSPDKKSPDTQCRIRNQNHLIYKLNQDPQFPKSPDI